MTTMTPPTSRDRKPAAQTPTKRPHWRDSAACTDAPLADFYDDRGRPQQRARGFCHGCTVIDTCLSTTLKFEGLAGYKWGVSGGLTADQRRALRCEILLGDSPDLAMARELMSLRWRHVLYPLRKQGVHPREMARALEETFGLKASPCTVRLSVWWLGGKAPVRPRRGPGDGRLDWQLVRDECRDVVDRLRELGAPVADIAAYLNVSKNSLETAIRSWKAQAQENLGVAA